MRESPGPGAQRNPKTDGGRLMGEGWGSPRARGGWEGSFLTIKCNKSPPARGADCHLVPRALAGQNWEGRVPTGHPQVCGQGSERSG